MINKTVSYYNNADDSKSRIRYNLDYVLGMIRDNQELFQQTVRIRAMPTEEEQGVATIGPDVCVGTGAKIGLNAMISEDVKDGEEK